MCVFCRMYGYGLEEEGVMPCNASLQTCTPSMYLTGSPVSAHCAQLMDGSVSGADLRLDRAQNSGQICIWCELVKQMLDIPSLCSSLCDLFSWQRVETLGTHISDRADTTVCVCVVVFKAVLDL